MSNHTGFANWITAISTAATAIAAAVAGFIAWQALRRDIVRSLPIVETNLKWISVGDATCLALEIIIRNQLLETISLDTLRIDSPRGSVFGGAKFVNLTGYAGQETLAELTRGATNAVTINQQIDPVGTLRTIASGFPPQKADTWERTLYLWPPEAWDGGIVKVTFRISSKALTIRDKRIARKSRISARPIKQTEAKASKAGASIPY